MSDESYMIFQLLKQDPRYKLEAYQFIREGLSYGQNMMGLGEVSPSDESLPDVDDADDEDEDWEPPAERHLTGQDLCEAIRQYAVDQYGLMAKVVLNSWGLHSTSDFGEIVYNLIRIGMMKKSKTDRREDFDNAFDFDEAFTQQFQITKPD